MSLYLIILKLLLSRIFFCLKGAIFDISKSSREIRLFLFFISTGIHFSEIAQDLLIFMYFYRPAIRKGENCYSFLFAIGEIGLKKGGNIV